MSATIESFNSALKQLSQTAKVIKQSIKSTGNGKSTLHVETQAGIRLNITFDNQCGLINASYLISQLTNTNKSIVDKRVARWMRTKEGLWAVDMLKNDTSAWNESLVYEFKDQPIWDYDIDDFDDSRVYKQEFTTAVLEANLYDPKTNYFNLKPVNKTNTMYLFWIVNDRYSNEQFDCYCCREILNKLFERFNVWVDDDLVHTIDYAYGEAMKQRWMNVIAVHDKDKEDLKFFITPNGEIDYKIIERADHWHSIQDRGLEPVHENKWNVWSNVLGYKPIGAPDGAPMIDRKLVETDKSVDVNYYNTHVAANAEQQ